MAMALRAISNLSHEIQIQAAIDRPGVARIEAVYATEQTATLVMELVEGAEMFEHIVDSAGTPQLSKSRVARITRQILETIYCLHLNWVMHVLPLCAAGGVAGTGKEACQVVDLDSSVVPQVSSNVLRVTIPQTFAGDRWETCKKTPEGFVLTYLVPEKVECETFGLRRETMGRGLYGLLNTAGRDARHSRAGS